MMRMFFACTVVLLLGQPVRLDAALPWSPKHDDSRCPVTYDDVTSRVLVNCTGRNLTSVPTWLPNTTTVLYLGMNHISSLDISSFHHLPMLEEVNVDWNGLRHVSRGTFQHLTHLSTVGMEGNPLTPGSLEVILCELNNSPLSVNLAGSLCVNEPCDFIKPRRFFRCFRENGIGIDRLNLARNLISNHIDDGLLDGLSINQVNLANITFGSVETVFINITRLSAIKNLTLLNLSENRLTAVPKFDSDTKGALLTKLTTLILNNNNLERLLPDSFRGLESLVNLSINHNYAPVSEILSSSFQQLVNLRYLYLSYMKFTPWNGEHLNCMFNSSSLRHLDISHTYFNPTIQSSKSALFQCASSLQSLNVRHLFVGGRPGVDLFFRECFHGLHNLQELNMKYNKILVIYDGMFKDLHNLTRLYMENTGVGNLASSDFENLRNLVKLRLNMNSIQTVHNYTFSKLISLKSIDLSHNPWSCDCGLYWFKNTFTHNPNITVINYKNYTCDSPYQLKDVPVRNISLKYSDCIAITLSPLFYIILGLSACFGSILLLFALCYRYCWHLKFMYFRIKSRYRTYDMMQPTNGEQFRFDAFISYNRHDLSWVRHYLLPKMEQELEFHFCLHDRDWLAGCDIVENIVDSIECSRKVVLIVSNAFAQSQWCQLELAMAQHKLFENKMNNLILILLEDVFESNMTPRLALQMKTKTYIQWLGESKKERFYQQLKRVLQTRNMSLIDSFD